MEPNNITQAQVMQAHIAACILSGITVAAYCHHQQLKRSNYYYWQDKLRRVPIGKCIPIIPPQATAPVSIIFTSGHRICFKNMPSADYVKNLVNLMLHLNSHEWYYFIMRL